MRIVQHCYFALESDTISAVEMANFLSMDPDEVVVMGSRSPERPLPRYHCWKIVRRSTETIDGQMQHLVDRLSHTHGKLVSLVTEFDVIPVMMVVRYLSHEEGISSPTRGGVNFRAAAQPLGWQLEPAKLNFLTSIRATLTVDEYDLSEDDETA